MKHAIKRLAGLGLSWLVLGLSLTACGSAATPTTPATTAAVTTAPATTTAPANTALAVTTAANSPLATSGLLTTAATTTTAAVTTSPATNTAATSTTTAATATPTSAPLPTQIAVGPTITAGPTPQPTALTTGWVKDGVCYEVFVRSFFDSNGDGKGDLQGLIAKLDYLNDGNPNSTKSLGVNCIWLMPVTASPSYHGYDTTDYYKVNPDYGTNDDFKKLMQEAHKRGIYVITDLVLNHTSAQSDWFKQAASDPKSPYRDWYIFSPTDPGYAGPWGAQAWWKNPYGDGYYYGVFDKDLPDLNYRNPAVTKQAYDITRFWLQDMGVDGFRLDAAKHLIEDGKTQEDTPETHAWWRDFRQFYKGVKPDAFTIGEINGPSTELQGYYPDQLDAYFEFGLATNTLKAANNGQGLLLISSEKIASNIWPFQRYGTFLTNHDQQRAMNTLGGNVSKAKMAASALLTSPGLPFIYYGEEIGMQGDKPDPRIRTPMQWSSDRQGGFTGNLAWEPLQNDFSTVNVQTEDTDPNSLLSLYRRLIHTRRGHPALTQGDYTPVRSSASSVAAYLRHAGSEDVLVVLNLGSQPVSDLKLNLDESSLTAGSYTPQVLLSVAGDTPNLAALPVGDGGSIQDYAPVASLPAYSGYVVQLSKVRY